MAEDISAKLAEHDAEIRLLREGQEELKVTVDTGFTRMYAKMDSLVGSMVQGSKVNWGWIIGAVGVAATIIGLIVNDLKTDISRNERSTDRIEDLLDEFRVKQAGMSARATEYLRWLEKEQDSIRASIDDHQDGHPGFVLQRIAGMEKILDKLAIDIANRYQNQFTDKEGDRLQQQIDALKGSALLPHDKH